MYQLSKDYEKLFELIVSGESVVCFVDNSHDLAPKICRDVCLAKRSEKFGVQVSVRGTTYFGVYPFEAESAAEEKEIFVDGCQKINLEYVVPLRPELDRLRARVARLEEALTPSAATKMAYMGEFSFRETYLTDGGEEQSEEVIVPWTTIKDIMKAIASRALEENCNGRAENKY